MRVLVIEDDRELAEAIGAGLRRERMAVDLTFDGDAGLERALVYGYDVIVLDRDLPRMHGDEVCAHLMRQARRSRVLMLTASATIEDRVAGLGLGADDYLPKPFAFAELVARIRALLRRAQPALPPVLELGDLRLDPARRLFEPFQRLGTERTGRDSSGLGLSIVSAIARAHGGQLRARPLAAGGLEIQVWFPGIDLLAAGGPAAGVTPCWWSSAAGAPP